MNLFEKFQLGLSYQDFLAQYATEEQMKRWWQVHEQIKLTETETAALMKSAAAVKELTAVIGV